MTETHKPAALYLRQSLDRTGEGLAVARQREACRDLAAQRGWTVVEYVDNDTSASGKVPRPAYRRMLADIEAGTLAAVVAWDLDRLHRQPVELEEFIALADRRGIALATVTGEVDLSTDNGRLYARIKGAVARAEVERKGARQSAANAQRAKAGKPNSGRRPFGYNEDRVTLCEPEALLIKEAYEDILAGGSLAQITKTWQTSGLTPTQPRKLVNPEGEPRGPRTWTRNSIREILLNPRNAGLRSYKREIVGKAQWTSIVDENTWRSAVAILTDPSRRTSPTTARRWLLTSIATCGRCGGPVKAHWSTPKGGTRRRRYLCADGACVSRTADLADITVVQHIVKRLSRDDARELLIDTTRPDMAALRAEADVLRRRLDDMAASHAATGVPTLSQLTTATATITAKLTDLDQQMAHVDRAPLLRDLIEADDVAAAWESLNLDRQRAVVALLVRVTILPSPVGKRPEPESIRVESIA